MAKKAKLDEDIKISSTDMVGVNGTSDEQSNEQSYQSPPRALESAIIFVDSQRLLVRHLTDQRLLEQSAQLSVTMYKVRRELEGLENLYLNMNREKNFRGL